MKKNIISRKNIIIEESRVFDNEEICNNPTVNKQESFVKSQPSVVIFNNPNHSRVLSNTVHPMNSTNMGLRTNEKNSNFERVLI